MLIKVSVLAGCAFLALIYVQMKIYQLLQEKDTELRFRSIKRGVDQVDTLGSEDRDSERGDSFKQQRSNKASKVNQQDNYNPPNEDTSTNRSYKFRNQME